MRIGALPPPEGWDIISPVLEELQQRMRDAELEPHENKRVAEASWRIFQLHHQRSRYIYEMFYVEKAISKTLYNYCLDQKFADASLIAKWKKQGYERLCCLRCIQSSDTNYGTTCICRVPRSKMDASSRSFQCQHCGCRGCSG